MITRLRSEKGSFVRSPLGAFETALAEVSYIGETFTATTDPSNSRFKFDVCTVTNTNAGTTGWWSLGFGAFVGEPPPLANWPNLYIVGQTSGAVWRPADDGVAQICVGASGGFGNQFWGGTNNITLGSGFVYEYHCEVQQSFDGAKDVLNGFALYVNTGEFPSTTPPAFANNEAVSFQSVAP